MADPTPSEGPRSENRMVMIVLSYIWILALVPLFVEKRDPEVQWHAKHGLVLFAAEIIFWIAFSIVSSMLSVITGGLGCLMAILTPFIGLGILALHVVAIIKGLNGQRLIIPGVSEYASRF